MICSCSRDRKVRLTPREAMKTFRSMSVDSGAMYYAQQRSLYPFLDTLYRDSILPVLETCSYFEIKAAYFYLEKTPVADEVQTLFQIVREDLLYEIKEDLEQMNQREQDMFITNMLPMIDLGIDSIVQKNIKKTVSQYAGGLLNFRKLYFMVGVNEKKFSECWHNNVNVDCYEAYLKSCINDYCQMIVENKVDYISSFIECKQDFYILDSPLDFQVELSSRVFNSVAEFTKKERNDLFVVFFKDFVAPALLSYISAPISVIYESINLGYDVFSVTKEDLENQEYDENMFLSDLCSEDIENQIQESAYPILIATMRKTIHSINQQAYDYLSIAL